MKKPPRQCGANDRDAAVIADAARRRMRKTASIDAAIVRVPRVYLAALSNAVDALADLLEGDGLKEHTVRAAHLALQVVSEQDKRLPKDVKEALGLWD